MTCHEPHGSNHMKMLKVKEPFLCQRCHSETRHPGTLYDQTQLTQCQQSSVRPVLHELPFDGPRLEPPFGQDLREMTRSSR